MHCVAVLNVVGGVVVAMFDELGDSDLGVDAVADCGIGWRCWLRLAENYCC